LAQSSIKKDSHKINGRLFTDNDLSETILIDSMMQLDSVPTWELGLMVLFFIGVPIGCFILMLIS